MSFSYEDVIIGRVSGSYAGYRHSAYLAISVSVTEKNRATQTVEHESLSEYLSLGISAGVWNRQRTDFIICGQCRDALDNMVSYAPGWDKAKVARLGQIWDEWHLNDISAACAHQVVPEVPDDVSRLDATQWLLDNVPPCPVTGYKWGSAWLTRNLPVNIAEELREMMEGNA